MGKSHFTISGNQPQIEKVEWTDRLSDTAKVCAVKPRNNGEILATELLFLAGCNDESTINGCMDNAFNAIQNGKEVFFEHGTDTISKRLHMLADKALSHKWSHPTIHFRGVIFLLCKITNDTNLSEKMKAKNANLTKTFFWVIERTITTDNADIWATVSECIDRAIRPAGYLPSA